MTVTTTEGRSYKVTIDPIAACDSWYVYVIDRQHATARSAIVTVSRLPWRSRDMHSTEVRQKAVDAARKIVDQFEREHANNLTGSKASITVW